MSKHNCFQVLKLALCWLFFAATVSVFGVIVDVPNSITNESGKNFYVEHDKERNLWFCMELVTQENIEWWSKRVAYEKYILRKCQEPHIKLAAEQKEKRDQEILAKEKEILAKEMEAVREELLPYRYTIPAIDGFLAKNRWDKERDINNASNLDDFWNTFSYKSFDIKKFILLEFLLLQKEEYEYIILGGQTPYQTTLFDEIRGRLYSSEVLGRHIRRIIPNIDEFLKSNDYSLLYPSPQTEDSITKPLPYQDEIESDTAFMKQVQESILRKVDFSFWGDFKDSTEGFDYNLSTYARGGKATWVAYISSVPVDSPLYLQGNILFPHLIMVVTVKIGDPIYSPLGIFRSPIAIASGESSRFKNISMPLHSFIASIVPMISPGVKYMVFRPLSSMLDIINKSGIKYTVSGDGENQKVMFPYVTFLTLTRGNTKLFSLYDPRTDIRYFFDDEHHWFALSPYLGNNSIHMFVQSPFIVIDRADLAECTNRVAHTGSLAATTVTSVNPRVNVAIFPVTASSAGEGRPVLENKPPLIGSEANRLPFATCKTPYKWAPSFNPTICAEPPSISMRGEVPGGVLFRLPVAHFNKGDRISMRGNLREGKIEFGLAFDDEHGWVCANTLEVGNFDSTVTVPIEGNFRPLFMCDKNLGIDATITDISLP